MGIVSITAKRCDSMIVYLRRYYRRCKWNYHVSSKRNCSVSSASWLCTVYNWKFNTTEYIHSDHLCKRVVRSAEHAQHCHRYQQDLHNMNRSVYNARKRDFRYKRSRYVLLAYSYEKRLIISLGRQGERSNEQWSIYAQGWSSRGRSTMRLLRACSIQQLWWNRDTFRKRGRKCFFRYTKLIKFIYYPIKYRNYGNSKKDTLGRSKILARK